MWKFRRALQYRRISFCGLYLISSFLTGMVAANAAQMSPKVVVSIKPLHSIVAGIMQGGADPVLLVSGTETPHGFSLRPSQARELESAALVFWVGPELEKFLEKSVNTLARQAEIVALGHAVPLLPYRKHALWRKANRHAAHDYDKHKNTHRHAGHYSHGTRDPHFWLDPVLMLEIVPIIVRGLSKVDPANAHRFRSNEEILTKRLEQLHWQLKEKLLPVRQVPYLVFHDAYQYLEARYRLASVGSVTLDPERPPGARHLARIRRDVLQNKAQCLFKEPQFRPSIINVVREKVAIRLGELDPLGVTQRPGPDAYFNTLKNLAENLANCLGDSSR